MANRMGNRHEVLMALLQTKKEKLENALHAELTDMLHGENHDQFREALDTADLCQVDLEESLGIKLVDLRQEELGKMIEAERKLHEGTYGICEICGEQIGEGRLSALPSAIYCFRCAEHLERAKAHTRIPRPRLPRYD